jgi:hypothetical protein
LQIFSSKASFERSLFLRLTGVKRQTFEKIDFFRNCNPVPLPVPVPLPALSRLNFK